MLHDFGGPWALTWGARRPERLASVTLIDTGVAPGYRWHRQARVWRTPLAGELAMATMNRFAFRRLLRRGQTRPLPGPFVERMYREFNRGTRQAVLDLYRSTDIAAEAERLVPALRPQELPALENSGHWPFVDRSEGVEELLLDFLVRTHGREPAPAPTVTA